VIDKKECYRWREAEGWSLVGFGDLRLGDVFKLIDEEGRVEGYYTAMGEAFYSEADKCMAIVAEVTINPEG